MGWINTGMLAGLAALAIPEVMGYTKIAGTPVITGLYTILIPMALYAIFGSSRHLVVGADSATAAILAAGLVGLASVGSDEYVALAGVLAILVAVFLFLARVARLGFLADFLSSTVLVGFLTGVGIQVAFGQIGGMLGLEVHGHGTLGKILADLQHIGETNFYALAIAVAVLALIVGLKRVSPKIPGALIAVIGWFIAKILKSVVASLLSAAGLDRLGAKMGLKTVVKVAPLGMMDYTPLASSLLEAKCNIISTWGPAGLTLATKLGLPDQYLRHIRSQGNEPD